MKAEIYKVVIKATGDNASGKSRLLRIIRDFLKSKGFNVKDKSANHKLIILNRNEIYKEF